jgi:DNA-binding SARP family transcriptional activator/tetratricopeptide (TPR) repeat protein
MRFGVLGPLVVWRDGRPVELGGMRQQGLLAVLLLRANEAVPTERVVDCLWGERPPASASKAVKALVWKLRKLLGEGVIETARGGYLLRAQREAIDSRQFEDLLGRGRRLLGEEAAGEASEVLAEALGLWRGPPYADFGFEEFARSEVARLEELRLVALEARLEADLALGGQGELVGELRGLVLGHPLRERLRGLLMLALYRAGRQVDALEVYQQGRTVLVEELGLEPSESLKQIEQAILRHDASLEPRAATAIPPAPIGEAEAPAHAGIASTLPVRKTVTVMVCGVATGSDPERLDPESSRVLMGRYFETAAVVLARHGGAVEAFVGDAVVGVFGVPLLHEDDAERAVRAAEELRAAVAELNRGLERDFGTTLALRVGINTGEVVIGTESRLAAEAVVAAAGRLQQTAPAGEVVLGPDTVALVRDAVKTEPLAAPALDNGVAARFRLLAVDPRGPRVARRLDAPMVGRAPQLGLLEDVFASAVGRPGCRLVTVVGEAGVGKSRLAGEFLNGLDARVMMGSCPSYGEGITYWPLVELVTQVGEERSELLAATPAAEAAIASLLGESAAPTTPDEIAWAARKLFEALAHERPLVMLLDDLHWAEPTLLDLVERVAQLTQAAPIMLLCLARPELLERRPGWGSGRPNTTTILLAPLGPAETQELIGQLLHGGELAADLAARIQESARGNPLFVEEMLAIVQESDTPEVIVPPTIKALLAARVDQLDPAERELLGCGAVEGELFHRGAVETLTACPAEHQLAGLVRKELLQPDRSQLAAEDAYRFRHVLIRDAAYDALPKSTRAGLHERLASWLEHHGGDLVERDEIVGYHLQQAHRYRTELGDPEPEIRLLRERAAGFLAAAGRRASVRGDHHAVAKLLERALALGLSDSRERVSVQLEFGRALFETGRIAESEALLTTTRDAAVSLAERGLAERALVHGLRSRLASDPAVGWTDVVSVAEGAIKTFEALGDMRGLAEAEILLAGALHQQGRTEESFAGYERALHHAEAAGATEVRREIIARISARLCDGATPVPEAIGRLGQLLSIIGNDRVLEAAVTRCLSFALAMAGDFEAANAHLHASTPVLDEADETRMTWSESRWFVYEIKELMGDENGAEEDLMAVWLHFRDIRGDNAEARALRAAASLARLYCDQGRWDEAAEYLAYGEEVDRAPPVYGKVYTDVRLAARARVAANRGRASEALELARTALDVIEWRNSPNDHAQVLLALAEVQRAAGDSIDADAAVLKALELYEQKGNIAAAARLSAEHGMTSST